MSDQRHEEKGLGEGEKREKGKGIVTGKVETTEVSKSGNNISQHAGIDDRRADKQRKSKLFGDRGAKPIQALKEEDMVLTLKKGEDSDEEMDVAAPLTSLLISESPSTQ